VGETTLLRRGGGFTGGLSFFAGPFGLWIDGPTQEEHRREAPGEDGPNHQQGGLEHGVVGAGAVSGKAGSGGDDEDREIKGHDRQHDHDQE